jgi:tetratricopeptide (TPR) repeat protein
MTHSRIRPFPRRLCHLEPRLENLSDYERIELATSYFALGRPQDGKREWEKAINADPASDTPVSNFTIAEELMKAGDFDSALPHLQRAYELDPQNLTYRMDYDKVREGLSK